MVALFEACQAGTVPAEIALVISDVADAGILERCRSRRISCRHIAPGDFRTKLSEEAEQDFVQALRSEAIDWVVLAGFMRILKGNFLRAFPYRVVNIHPSLLPSFPGLTAWSQALEYGVKVTGCTVHLVDQGMDTGPILGQRTVPVLDGDTAESLHERIQQEERKLYPEVIRGLVCGEFKIEGRRTTRCASADQ